MNNRSLIPAALLGTAYAVWLSTEDGKARIDENTTVGVVLGVAGMLGALRLTLPSIAWRHAVGAFVAAGAPLVVRGGCGSSANLRANPLGQDCRCPH
jgi:hypothetical protein